MKIDFVTYTRIYFFLLSISIFSIKKRILIVWSLLGNATEKIIIMNRKET
jgi:hypothetical protein